MNQTKLTKDEVLECIKTCERYPAGHGYQWAKGVRANPFDIADLLDKGKIDVSDL